MSLVRGLLLGSACGALVGGLATQANTTSVVTCRLKGAKMSNKGVVIDSIVYAPAEDVAKTLKTTTDSTPARKGDSALDAIEGRNLVINGDFESSNGIYKTANKSLPIFGWQEQDGPVVAKYVGEDVKIYQGDRPEHCSDQYFVGGKGGPHPTISQTLSLLPYAKEIEAGKVHFDSSAMLSGFASQPDKASLVLEWQNSTGKILSVSKVDGPTPADRKNFSKFFKKELSGTVPKGSTQVRLSITTTGGGGTWIDGYADNVVFTLRGQK